MEIQLTKREYLGDGYVHQFINIATGEVVLIPCTEEDYNALTTKSPSLEGHTWQGSTGGTYKVDTPNTVLGLNEYCDLPSGKQVVRLYSNGMLDPEVLLDAATIKNDTVDEAVVLAKKQQDLIRTGVDVEI
tara:strand:- start:977 stop:1369 length:393 start_codon:yes stop_codon:yes gene_type:complete